ncbi:hypothetical protein K1719_020472 [Acacia pycnantha]|nr:hypothetical protein K1719_020472 [Acacia pycnantha]
MIVGQLLIFLSIPPRLPSEHYSHLLRTCRPGHGISIGSLGIGGTYGAVEEVYVKSGTFTITSNGARIKTREGGYGYVRKVTFEDIIMKDVQHPVLIDQYDTAFHANGNIKATKIDDITFRNFRGTSALPEAVKLIAVGCTNLRLDNIKITSSDPKMKTKATAPMLMAQVLPPTFLKFHAFKSCHFVRRSF